MLSRKFGSTRSMYRLLGSAKRCRQLCQCSNEVPFLERVLCGDPDMMYDLVSKQIKPRCPTFQPCIDTLCVGWITLHELSKPAHKDCPTSVDRSSWYSAKPKATIHFNFQI